MYARLVSARVRRGKLDEAVRVWKEADIPLMDSVKGYRGAYLLSDPKSDKAISITLWDSEEDSLADQRSQLHKKQVGMYEGLMTGRPIHRGYKIVARDKV